jgi:hypothetical protein
MREVDTARRITAAQAAIKPIYLQSEKFVDETVQHRRTAVFCPAEHPKNYIRFTKRRQYLSCF